MPRLRMPLTFCKKPTTGGRKKKKKTLEAVDSCDNCGAPLGRECVRSYGSAVCAVSDGIHVARFSDGEALKPHFFCSAECKLAFAADWQQTHLF